MLLRREWNKQTKKGSTSIIYPICVGMATKPIHVVTRPNQIQFDGFFPVLTGFGMSLGFPRFQNTGMRRVTGI